MKRSFVGIILANVFHREADVALGLGEQPRDAPQSVPGARRPAVLIGVLG